MKTKLFSKTEFRTFSIFILIIWISNVYTIVNAQDLKSISSNSTLNNNEIQVADKINPNLAVVAGTKVHISNFYVLCNADETHTIYWNTICEPDSVYYTIYKNYDPVNWQYAVTFPLVQGMHHGNTPHLYSVTDMVVNQPDTYYLLVVTKILNNKSSNCSYGPIMGTECEDKHMSMNVYPNPASDVAYVTIEGMDAEKECLVSLYNENGLPVQGVQTSRDGNTVSLNMNDLKPGRYFVHVVIPETAETFSKVIVKM